MSTDGVRSGLEGVVAFATEIAEPDREQKRQGRLIRPTALYVGEGPRPLEQLAA